MESKATINEPGGGLAAAVMLIKEVGAPTAINLLLIYIISNKMDKITEVLTQILVKVGD